MLWLLFADSIVYYLALVAGLIFLLRKNNPLGYTLLIAACVNAVIFHVFRSPSLDSFVSSITTAGLIIFGAALFVGLVHWHPKARG